VTTLAQCGSKSAKERRSRALQGQKRALHVKTSYSGADTTKGVPLAKAIFPDGLSPTLFSG
jgi:hypothetical protein